MYHKFIILLLCMNLMAAQAFAKDKEPLVLSPSSKWNIDYAEDSCTLGRTFGEGENKSLLTFRRFSPSDSPRMVISGLPFKTRRNKVTYQFGIDKIERDRVIFNGTRGDAPALIFNGQIDIVPLTEQQLLERKKAYENDDFFLVEKIKPAPITDDITTLLISGLSRTPVLLQTGAFIKPMAALDKCIDDLVTTWGVDAEKHKSLMQPVLPTVSPQRWLNSSDYPTSLLNKGNQGIVNFRLIVTPDGEVESCHIQLSTRPVGFDEAVCQKISKRAKFKPALDAEGRPLKSFYTNTVNFRIPR